MQMQILGSTWLLLYWLPVSGPVTSPLILISRPRWYVMHDIVSLCFHKFWRMMSLFIIFWLLHQVKCVEVFREFYQTKTKHRKLTWIYSLGTCNISGKFEPKTIELIVTTYQVIDDSLMFYLHIICVVDIMLIEDFVFRVFRLLPYCYSMPRIGWVTRKSWVSWTCQMMMLLGCSIRFRVQSIRFLTRSQTPRRYLQLTFLSSIQSLQIKWEESR